MYTKESSQQTFTNTKQQFGYRIRKPTSKFYCQSQLYRIQNTKNEITIISVDMLLVTSLSLIPNNTDHLCLVLLLVSGRFSQVSIFLNAYKLNGAITKQ